MILRRHFYYTFNLLPVKIDWLPWIPYDSNREYCHFSNFSKLSLSKMKNYKKNYKIKETVMLT